MPIVLQILRHEAELGLGRALHVVAVDRLTVVKLADLLDVVLHASVRRCVDRRRGFRGIHDVAHNALWLRGRWLGRL